MRLDVAWLVAGRSGKRDEGAYLVNTVGKDLAFGASDFAAAKVYSVRKCRMSTCANSQCRGAFERVQNRRGIAGVKSTCNIDGSHKLEKFLVVGAAFADVGIQVKLDGRAHTAIRFRGLIT